MGSERWSAHPLQTLIPVLPLRQMGASKVRPPSQLYLSEALQRRCSIDEVDPQARTPLETDAYSRVPRNHPAAVFNVDQVDNGIGPHLSNERVPDLVRGMVTTEPASLITMVLIHHGPSAHTCYSCVALLDSGSSHTFVQEAVREHTRQTVAATAAYEVLKHRRVWGGSRESTPLSASKSVQLSVHFSTMAMSLPPDWLFGTISCLLARCNTQSYLGVTARRVLTRVHIARSRLAVVVTDPAAN